MKHSSFKRGKANQLLHEWMSTDLPLNSDNIVVAASYAATGSKPPKLTKSDMIKPSIEDL